MSTKPMTVGDLIDALSKFDRETRVVIGDEFCEFAHDICHPDPTEGLIEMMDGEKAVLLDPQEGDLML